jgi:catechol 2,3-dioxygenase-like lactoylglutathione lyase family enzyme
MENAIANLVQQFEAGQIDRRQLVAGLGALVAVLSGTRPARADEEDGSPTFEAVGLNHIALRVTDVLRSREFYKKHLGLKVTRDGGERNCFMTCGKNFVALFHSDQAQMDHYCYSVNDYDVNRAEAKLNEQGLEPRVVRDAGRIYFKDPDGLTVQLAASDRRP